MARKGIDSTFLHYGIRTSDMDIIQEIENLMDLIVADLYHGFYIMVDLM